MRAGERRVRVWIVGDNFGFPNGAGATARVHGFAAAFRAAGAEPRIFCATPTELPGPGILNTEPSGVHEGVAFEYACGTTTLPERWTRRRWLRVRSARRLRSLARESRRAGAAPDVVIATAQTISGLLLALATARAAGARCVLDACEMPSNFVRVGVRRRLHQRAVARVGRALDAVLCISTALERHWGASARTLRVPILADVAGTAPGAADGSHRIVYAGNLAHADEVRILLESFAILARANADARLQILGDDPGTDAVARFRALAEQLAAGARVELSGALVRTAAARAIASAAVLALPRPRTPWSEAGLSAKLADYLATGRPVVTTGIGDIPLYLTHGESAFVVAPGDPDAFAAALAAALADPAHADAIGRRGREVALAAFDVRVHGPRLVAFFESLR
jgi:glycosyltransferase involved in cell wall biosynthesis